MKRRNWIRIPAMAAALPLCAALLLGGCTVPSGNGAQRDTVKEAQKQTAKAAETIEMPEVSAPNVRGNTSGNIKNGGYATMQEDWIYYAGSDGIYRMKQDGSGVQKISDDEGACYINVIGDWLYYSLYEDERYIVYKIKTNGADKTQIAFPEEDWPAASLTVIGDRIYTFGLRGGSCKIGSMKTDGTDPFLADIKTYEENGILTTEGHVVAQGHGALYIMKQDGTRENLMNTASSVSILLAEDDGWAYYATGTDNMHLARVKTDLSYTKEALNIVFKPKISYAITNDHIRIVNISDGWLYYIDTQEQEDYALCKILLDGTKQTKIDGEAGISLCVVGDWIFCKSAYSGYRIRTDGTEKTPLE